MKPVSEYMTTTGRSSYRGSDVRKDFDEAWRWIEAHSIDAPSFIANGDVFYSENLERSITGLVYREHAYQGY